MPSVLDAIRAASESANRYPEFPARTLIDAIARHLNEVIERHRSRGFGAVTFKALFEAVEREQVARVSGKK